MKIPLLEIRNLQKSYPVYSPLGKLLPPKTYIRAVSNMSLDLYEGETYGLVGRSSCGKSTAGCSILGLVEPDESETLYRDCDLARLSDGKSRPLRRDLQIAFQDTLSPLSPRSRIRALLEESLIAQGVGDTKGRHQEVLKTLERVRLSEDHCFYYPHGLSGGQIQHLGIVRTLIIEPKLIICGEPAPTLDVSIQSQISNMLTLLQRKMNLGILFIPHGTGVVRYISNRAGIVCLGILMEEAGIGQSFAHTLHPYTQALLTSTPDFSKRGGSVSFRGELPMHADEFKGYVPHTRHPYVNDRCRESAPELTEIRPGYRMACHRIS